MEFLYRKGDTSKAGSLYALQVAQAPDLEIVNAYIEDGTEIPGETTKVFAGVRNLGTKEAIQYDISVNGQVTPGSVSILPGESALLEAEYAVPDTVVNSEITVQITSEEDSDTSNNTFKLMTGYADVSVSASEDEWENGKIVRVSVANNEAVPTDAVLEVHKNTPDGEMVSSVELGTLEQGNLVMKEFTYPRGEAGYDVDANALYYVVTSSAVEKYESNNYDYTVFSEKPAAAPEPGESGTPAVSPEPGESGTPIVSPEPGESGTPTVSPGPEDNETPMLTITPTPKVKAEQKLKNKYGSGKKKLKRQVGSKLTQKVTGAKTKVTFSSSDLKVAKVGKTSGVITCVGVGKAVITSRAAESSQYKAASSKTTIYVIPRTANIKSVKSNKKRQVTVKGTNGSADHDGYYIQYKHNGKIKTVKTADRKTVTRTFKNLKSGKNFKVRMCAYKKVKGVTYYGNYGKWKNLKKVK